MRSSTPFGAAAAAFALAACGAIQDFGSGGVQGRATAELQPTRGNTARGKASFEQRGDTVVVRARLSGLKPGQEHGFHIHEKGDCSSGDGLSAGGHFNRTAQPHAPPDGAHHAGDLPSLRADAAGSASRGWRSAAVRPTSSARG